MNKKFLDEVWTHVTTSLYAIEYWADYRYRGDNNEIIEVQKGMWRDGKKSYFLNRHDLEADLRKLYDLASERVWQGGSVVDWGNNVVAGIAMQDISEWDDEVVDVFVQVSLLGEIVYG